MNVWYAAYGSNLLEDRFLAYLRGGPIPVSGRTQHGARDAADPLENRPFPIERAMAFGGESKTWGGGGVAFVDPYAATSTTTYGRAWLITAEQLADVWAQENGGTVGPDLDLDLLAERGSADLGRGWYRRLEFLGTLDGLPVATITCETLPPVNAAGPAYLEVVGRGVMTTWGLSAAQAADYLAAKAGNNGTTDRGALAALLAGT